jgi:hypothetical protein
MSDIERDQCPNSWVTNPVPPKNQSFDRSNYIQQQFRISGEKVECRLYSGDI